MNKKKIAFDVGACQGESFYKFEDYDEIYCFEPLFYNYDKLIKYFSHDKRLKFFDYAISDEEGIFDFYFHEHYAYSSLNEIDPNGDFTNFCYDYDPGFDIIRSVEKVQAKRLDNFIKENNIEHIDYLKIDTQGNDLKVIKSLGEMISYVKTIELEFQIKTLYKNSPTKEEIINYMNENHFILVSDESTSSGLESFERTLIFENKNNYESLHKSIPVIGTAVVNSSYWVKRLLESIDYPVDTFFIVNNNGKGELDDDLDELKNINHKFVKNVKVCHLPGNIGCSGAWNLIIKSFIMEPYWIIVNDDVAFDKGFLKEMVETSLVNKEVGIIHGNSGDFNVGSWDLFLIKDFVVEKIGLFDENCYPAYCEDADYIMRLMNSQIERITSLKSNYFHGDGNKTEYYEHASQTSKKDPILSRKLRIANDMNIEYMTEKWGPHWRGCNPRELPFMDKEHHISETRYDLKFLRKKYTGF